jgi:hypothetical protein
VTAICAITIPVSLLDTLKREDTLEDTLMEQANSNKRAVGRVMFRTVGLCSVLLFLLWNPLVLRPRFWNTTVVVRSLSIDTTLLVIGMGLICLRRWAALLASVLAAYVAIDSASTGGGFGVPLTLIILTPLPLTVVCWRDLVWGDKRRDLLLALASLIVSALFHYAAFLIHHA